MKKLTTKEYKNQIKNRDIICIEEYVDIHTPISHKCLVCNYIWKGSPNNIKNKGSGCPKCSGQMVPTTKEYKEQIKNTSVKCIDEYLYAYTPILHKCKKCNYEWKIAPLAVKSGRGCPICAKEKSYIDKYLNIPTILYYIYIPKYDVYKIGVTKSSVNKRYSIEDLGIIEIIFEKSYKNGLHAIIIEKEVIKRFKKFKWNPSKTERFGGWTECFTKNILSLL